MLTNMFEPMNIFVNYLFIYILVDNFLFIKIVLIYQQKRTVQLNII